MGGPKCGHGPWGYTVILCRMWLGTVVVTAVVLEAAPPASTLNTKTCYDIGYSGGMHKVAHRQQQERLHLKWSVTKSTIALTAESVT